MIFAGKGIFHLVLTDSFVTRELKIAVRVRSSCFLFWACAGGIECSIA